MAYDNQYTHVHVHTSLHCTARLEIITVQILLAFCYVLHVLWACPGIPTYMYMYNIVYKLYVFKFTNLMQQSLDVATSPLCIENALSRIFFDDETDPCTVNM